MFFYDILLSFILGSLIKLYDELIDNNIYINKNKKNLLKGLIIIIYTYLGFKYPLIILYTFFLFISSYLSDTSILEKNQKKELKEMDNEYWTILFYYTLLLLVIIIFKNKYNILKINYKNIKVITFTIMIFITLILIVTEFYLIKEEYSRDKLIVRCFYIFVCILFLIISSFYKNLFYYNIVLFIIFWFLGYFITWILFKKIYLKNKKRKKLLTISNE